MKNVSAVQFAGVCCVIRFRRNFPEIVSSNYHNLIVWFFSSQRHGYCIIYIAALLFSILGFQRDGHSEPTHLFCILTLGWEYSFRPKESKQNTYVIASTDPGSSSSFNYLHRVFIYKISMPSSSELSKWFGSRIFTI